MRLRATAFVASLVAVIGFTGVASGEPALGVVDALHGAVRVRDAGKLREARRHFVTCAADGCPKALRIDCARWLEEVDSTLPSLVFVAKDRNGADLFDVRVFVDGERVEGHEQGKAVPFDPGPHVVRFEHAGSKPVEQKVLLRAGERNRAIAATFDDAPPAEPTKDEPRSEGRGVPTAALVFGAIGLGALGSFGFFAVSGNQEKDQLRSTCGSRCTDDQIASLKTSYIAADVSLGVGIVALGLATYFLLTNDGPKRTSAR